MVAVRQFIHHVLFWGGWHNAPTLAAVIIAAWAAWQSKRAADGTQRTATLMNSQWATERYDRALDRYEHRKNALITIRTELSMLAETKASITRSLGSWVYCREVVAQIYPQTAAFIDIVNQKLVEIERHFQGLREFSLRPIPPPTGGYSSSPSLGGVESLHSLREAVGLQLEEAVQRIDADLAAFEKLRPTLLPV